MTKIHSVALARTMTLTRCLGAVAVLAVGVDHIEQYYVDYYRAVPTIGTLFVLDFISAAVVAVGLVLPLGRLTRRFGDRLLTLLALAGVGIGAGTLAGLLISENAGLFGFMEVGYRSAMCFRSSSTSPPSPRSRPSSLCVPCRVARTGAR